MRVFVLVDKQEGLGKQYMYFNNNFLIDFILFFFFSFFQMLSEFGLCHHRANSSHL